MQDLVEQARVAPELSDRREAFISLVTSADWQAALDGDVLSQQGDRHGDGFLADWSSFRQVAPSIAASEDQVQRCLELIEERFAVDLLLALALEMGEKLADLAMAHLRTAKGYRRTLLQKVIYASDANWVRRSDAKRIIQRQLRRPDLSRGELMNWLAEAGNLGDFVEDFRECLPESFGEWGALGKANLYDEELIDQALALLPQVPGTLAYLLRLDPLPAAAAPRMFASARGEWVVGALETAILEGLHHETIIPLAEIAVRLGGVAMATAYAWISNAQLSTVLLNLLKGGLRRDGDRVAEALWVQRETYSGDRALAEGRQGRIPKAMDAAALIREIQGDRAVELAEEILTEPREQLMEPILRPLCATNQQAARAVMALTSNENPEVAKRAQDARQWKDVAWPV